MNTALTLQPEKAHTKTLKKVELNFRKEARALNDAFALLGWQDLPNELKNEIVMDVAGMVNELNGKYCSIDAGVDKRRKRVTYWVECYRRHICTLETAVNALCNN